MDINALTEMRGVPPQSVSQRGGSSDFMALIATARGGTEDAEKPEMTLSEYKEYIYNIIYDYTFAPSDSRDFIAVNISDEGFEAMMNDKEYETWVLDKIAEDFFAYDPWASRRGTRYGIKYFGATKEEYHSESWYSEPNDIKSEEKYKRKTKDSFWSKRLERMAKIQKMWEELDLKKKFYREHNIDVIPTVNARYLLELLMMK